MTKHAIVTGASRGIGKEICKNLADRNHKVIAVARSEKPLQQLSGRYPEHITAIPADLTDEEEINVIAQYAETEGIGIDVLINNAGALINKPFSELTLDDWRSQLESNIISAVAITRQLLPFFSEEAHIVNISSMGGFQGSAKFPGLSSYSVAKGGLSILTECLAVELSEQQIKANALCLGAVQTDMLEEAFPGIEAPVAPEEMGEYIAEFALTGYKFYNGKILPVALEDPE